MSTEPQTVDDRPELAGGVIVIDFQDGTRERRAIPAWTAELAHGTWNGGDGFAVYYCDGDGDLIESWMVDFGKPERRWPRALTVFPAGTLAEDDA